MILTAVIVGYFLGVAPFVLPKIIELIKEERVEKEIKNTQIKEESTQAEILDEWFNGPKEKRVNQEDIYNEYITGKEVAKGE